MHRWGLPAQLDWGLEARTTLPEQPQATPVLAWWPAGPTLDTRLVSTVVSLSFNLCGWGGGSWKG